MMCAKITAATRMNGGKPRCSRCRPWRSVSPRSLQSWNLAMVETNIHRMASASAITHIRA
jgi:hypothetical protein